MELIEYPDRDMMMMHIADQVASDLSTALTSHERATIAVPGGTTPGPIFDTLSGAALQWGRVDVLLTDERWVPESSDRSNTALLRARLLRDKAAAATLVPLYAPADAPEDRLEELSAGVEKVLPLSVVLLGMGEDMHIASLFPGADRLEEAMADDAPPLMAMRGGGAPEPRVTLTLPVLCGAISLHLVITGEEKRAALERARQLTPDKAPVAAVLRGAKIHWAA